MKHEKEMVNMNLAFRKDRSSAEKRKDHRHCRNIVRLEDLFSIEITIFQFKLKKSEHALGLCSDMIAFCERSGRWSRV